MANDQEDIYSKAVRAGKRTYFFDVRATRGKDLYLTITESKKRSFEDGTFRYEKHKIYLYKEDFEKFLEGYQETIQEIDRLRATGDFKEDDPQDYTEPHDASTEEPSKKDAKPSEEDPVKKYTDVNFDDLEG